MTPKRAHRLSIVPDVTLLDGVVDLDDVADRGQADPDRADPSQAEETDIDLAGPTDIDLAELTDIDPDAAFGPVIADAEREMRRARTAVDAELAAAGLIGILDLGMADGPIPPDITVEQLRDVLLMQLIVMFEDGARPAGLAALRALSVVASDDVRPIAHEAAQRMAATGIKDKPWVKQIGAPRPGRAWCYSDFMGDQEAWTLTFHYGRREHALNVLIDNNLGGGIKDCWVGEDAEAVWRRVQEVAEDPTAEIETRSWSEAVARLREAAAEPRCAVQPDQIEDVAMTEAVLQARLAFLDGQVRRPDMAFTGHPG